MTSNSLVIELETKLTQFLASKSSSQSDYDDLLKNQEKVKQLNKEKQTFESIIQQLNTKIKELNFQMNNLKKENSSLHSKIESFQNQIKELEFQNRSLSLNFFTSDIDLLKLKVKLSEVETDLSQYQFYLKESNFLDFILHETPQVLESLKQTYNLNLKNYKNQIIELKAKKELN
jgi:chromosome segregation ATPase